MTESEKTIWRQQFLEDSDTGSSWGRRHFAISIYGPLGEAQERDNGKLKVFGYWVGNQDAKQFVKTGVGSTWADALEQALTFAEGQK